MIIWQICVVKRLYIGIYFNSTYKSCGILLRTVTISKNGCQILLRLTNLFYTPNVASLFGFTHSADWTDFDWYIGIGNDEINNFLCCLSNIFRLIHFLSELSLRIFRIVSEPFHRRFLQITEGFHRRFLHYLRTFFVYSVLFEGTIYPVGHLLNRYPSVLSSIQIINVA